MILDAKSKREPKEFMIDETKTINEKKPVDKK